jgi:hypothetical protein
MLQEAVHDRLVSSLDRDLRRERRVSGSAALASTRCWRDRERPDAVLPLLAGAFTLTAGIQRGRGGDAWPSSLVAFFFWSGHDLVPGGS